MSARLWVATLQQNHARKDQEEMIVIAVVVAMTVKAAGVLKKDRVAVAPIVIADPEVVVALETVVHRVHELRIFLRLIF